MVKIRFLCENSDPILGKLTHSATPPIRIDLAKILTRSHIFCWNALISKKIIFEKITLAPCCWDCQELKQQSRFTFHQIKNKRQSNSVTVTNKIWPPWPRKWPFDLNNLGRGSVYFFENYISFLKSGQSRTCYKLSSYADILMIGLCINRLTRLNLFAWKMCPLTL